MLYTKLIAILTIVLLLAGGVAKYGYNQYRSGFEKAKVEAEKALDDHMSALQKRQRIDQTNAIVLENALTVMEEKLETRTAEIINVVKTLDCKTLSPEFVRLFNDIISANE